MVAMSDATDLRKVYGRGYYDGLKEAGKLNNARMHEIQSNLSGIAKKVLDAVPIQTPWSCAEICAEIARTGSKPDHKIVMGCLNSLKEQKLIHEMYNEKGKPGFVKVPFKEKPKLVHVQAKEEEPMKVVFTAPLEVMAASQPPVNQDRLLTLASEIGVRMDGVSKELVSIAKLVETMALNCTEMVEKAQGEAGKLRQLQALLKSLGD
jgi:hypothetical protein